MPPLKKVKRSSDNIKEDLNKKTMQGNIKDAFQRQQNPKKRARDCNSPVASKNGVIDLRSPSPSPGSILIIK
jgi:hypothetical protein